MASRLVRPKVGKRSSASKASKSSASQFAGLSEDEKRKRLLALLQQDMADSGDRADKTWKMPDLTADGRTVDAGPEFSPDFQVRDVALASEGWQQLAKTCRIAFALDGSSWMPCTAKPRCLAERVATAIFAHHARGASFDPERSGAEWWAQVRQSGHKEEAIQFHWDTDEQAVEENGVNVHPHLSTVTYLTACGAPTLVLDRRNSLKPADAAGARGPIASGWLSYPRPGKHIAFDGQLLHGTVPRPERPEAEGERVTFLVNVWFNHRPSGCRRLPKDLAQRAGGAALEVGLSDSAGEVSEVSVPGGAGGGDGSSVLETCFSRCEGAAKELGHRLVVPLPPAPGAEGATELIRWPDGSGAGLWPAEGASSSASASAE